MFTLWLLTALISLSVSITIIIGLSFWELDWQRVERNRHSGDNNICRIVAGKRDPTYRYFEWYNGYLFFETVFQPVVGYPEKASRNIFSQQWPISPVHWRRDDFLTETGSLQIHKSVRKYTVRFPVVLSWLVVGLIVPQAFSPVRALSLKYLRRASAWIVAVVRPLLPKQTKGFQID